MKPPLNRRFPEVQSPLWGLALPIMNRKINVYRSLIPRNISYLLTVHIMTFVQGLCLAGSVRASFLSSSARGLPVRKPKNPAFNTMISVIIAIGFCSHAIGQQRSGETSRSARQAAQTLLDDAFTAEIYGNSTLRRENLEKIVSSKSEVGKITPEERRLSLWSLGNLEVERGRWMSLEDWIEKQNGNQALRQYTNLRDRATDSLQGHRRLAEFCVQNRLTAQARMHFAQVLRFDPNDSVARNYLGHTLLGPIWISPAQWKMVKSRQESLRESIQKYQRTLTRIERGLKSDNQATFKRAVQELEDLSDEAAVPAVELTFGGEPESVSHCAVNWLSKREGREASIALARFGIFHPDPRIRSAAAISLRGRPVVEYGAAVVDMALTPFSAAGSIPIHSSNGDILGFQETYRREGAEAEQMIVSPTGSQGTGSSLSAPRDIQAINRQTELINSSIASMLTTVSGETIPPNAEGIWNWWYREMETSRPERRYMSTHWSDDLLAMYTEVNQPRFRSDAPRPPPGVNGVGADQIVSADFVTPEYRRQQLMAAQMSAFREESRFWLPVGARSFSSECFVAGTPVMTERGLRPIESIRTGDLVLGKEIKTGQLAFRPVVQSTEREPIALIQIQLETETLICTPGHLFWLSGQGWTRARELQPGDVLHGARDPMKVRSVSDASSQGTFNLMVEEFSNYFVGESLVLTHDVTAHEYCEETIPGRK